MVSLMLAVLVALGGPVAKPDDAPADVRKAYEAQRAASPRDADAQVRLALWCEEHGLTTERMEHLAQALLSRPGHVLARALLGQVRIGQEWIKADDLQEKIAADARQAEALAEYNGKRSRTPMTAEGQWRLGVWCEEHGLKPEAIAHFTAVTRLDPKRVAVWKRLGCKKFGGRWMRPEQIEAYKSDVAAQREANGRWMTTLSSCRNALRGRDAQRRREAEDTLSKLDDRRAVPAIWDVFATGDVEDQTRAIQLLGQIVSPASTRALAILGLASENPEVRRLATEALVRRDPNDYLAPVIALLRRPLRFEVRPVGGPGSPGALFVEGELFNRQILYAPPAPGFLFVDTGASWNQDAYGFESIRLNGNPYGVVQGQSVTSFTGAEYRHGVAPGDPRAAALVQAQTVTTPQHLLGTFFKPQFATGEFANRTARDQDFTVQLNKTTTDYYATSVELPIGRIMNEYRIAAAASELQLEQDVAQLQAVNQEINQTNQRVNEFLSNVSGRPGKPDAQDWQAWWSDRQGYPYNPPPELPKETVVDVVPSPYIPAPIASTTQIGQKITTLSDYRATAQLTQAGWSHYIGMGFHPDCFAAGTLIATQTGSKPIEDLREGDLVLAQDPVSGALDFKPILTIYHFRPSPTYRLRVGSEDIVATPVHRFWVAGRGWVMARDLAPGDKIRTRSGLVEVASLEPADSCNVFNLEVADCHSFFVGTQGVLARDHSPMPVSDARPFDATVALAAPAGR